MEEKNLKQLEAIQGKNIKLNQDGFIKSQVQMQKIKFSLKKDIITIEDGVNGNYIKININQIYNIENNTNEITLFMDNDLKIKISILKKL